MTPRITPCPYYQKVEHIFMDRMTFTCMYSEKMFDLFSLFSLSAVLSFEKHDRCKNNFEDETDKKGKGEAKFKKTCPSTLPSTRKMTRLVKLVLGFSRR